MQQFHKQAIYVILTFQAKMLSYLEQLFCSTSSRVLALETPRSWVWFAGTADKNVNVYLEVQC